MLNVFSMLKLVTSGFLKRNQLGPADCEKNFNLWFLVSTRITMDTFERALKTGILFFFCMLNAIDMVQTWTFLRMGVEGNLFAVNNPTLWFLFKAAISFGLPLVLYHLDAYLDDKSDEGLFSYLNRLVSLVYLTILFADIFFLILVLKNIHILGHLLS